MSETVRAAARVAPIRRTLPALIAAGLVAAGPVRGGRSVNDRLCIAPHGDGRQPYQCL